MGVPKCLQQSDKQGPAPEFITKPSTNTKIVPKMSLIKPSHIERAVKFVSSNSTKMKSETSPIVSSFRETGDKVTISEHQKTNKEEYAAKIPTKEYTAEKILLHRH